MQYRCTWPVWPCSSGFLGWSSTRAPPLVPRSWGTKVCRSLLVNPQWFSCCSLHLCFSLAATHLSWCCFSPCCFAFFQLFPCSASWAQPTANNTTVASYVSTAAAQQHYTTECRHPITDTPLPLRFCCASNFWPNMTPLIFKLNCLWYGSLMAPHTISGSLNWDEWWVTPCIISFLLTYFAFFCSESIPDCQACGTALRCKS